MPLHALPVRLALPTAPILPNAARVGAADCYCGDQERYTAPLPLPTTAIGATLTSTTRRSRSSSLPLIHHIRPILYLLPDFSHLRRRTAVAVVRGCGLLDKGRGWNLKAVSLYKPVLDGVVHRTWRAHRHSPYDNP
ncbi:hypothetical protein B0H14DRAFT_3857387 [Mycena olivaceomarginata]|nr:hypothetical protein B0H14DRAFT_3857387 [Mycena olivaceomarginata]